MRLALTLACPEPLPFDHLPTLKGAFHRWSGHNPTLHDAQSLYSLSWLAGGRLEKGRLAFPHGARWMVSAADLRLTKQILAGIVNNPELKGHGLVVQAVDMVKPPVLPDGEHRFELLSPVFVHSPGNAGRVREHLCFDNPEAGAILTGTLQLKLRTAGLSDAGVSVRFAEDEPRAKTRVFQYKDIRNRVNDCPVLITGTSEQLAFAWCVGIGHSTGIGCGALK